MHIIPVMDLKDGRVVLAQQGRRHLYRPLVTPLCPTSDIIAVAEAYFSIFPFNTFYIADLNAIENAGDNNTIIKTLLTHYPHIHLWIDSGLTPFIADQTNPFYGRVTTILGSETHLSIKQLSNFMQKSNCILSLDYNDCGFIGHEALFADPFLLPGRIIIMSLPHIGKNNGPDLQRLEDISDKFPGKGIYAAGGIRDFDDLTLLKNKGISGALLASALHNKSINSESLNSLSQTRNFKW